METSLATDRECRLSRRPTLLIVDDEAGPRQSLEVIFKDDYVVLTAESGLEAMQLVRQHPVHVAILDIRMGGMSGIELLGRLKAHDQDMAVIMLTAFETVETACQALRLGACDYLSKPFNVSTMRVAVAEAVQRNRYAEQIRSNQEKLRALQAQLHDLTVQEEIARKRGEIYGTVLHDINNPLTVISSLAIMASEQLDQVSAPPSPDLAGVKEQLGQIEKQVGRCLDISKRYLGFARRQPGEQPVVQLNQVLADLGMLLKCHPVLAANEFRVKPPAEEILVQVNGTDLIQILLNLSINALQSTVQPHRVNVTTQLRKDPLTLADFPDGPNRHFFNRSGFANEASLVQISVQDNGPGITVVPMERIFEPFFTTKSTGQGTGLGLTIVLHLVEHARAGLYVETWPSQGATFALFLPVQTGPG